MSNKYETRYGMTFVTADGDSYHTFRDFGMYPQKPYTISEAEPEYTGIAVPYSNAKLWLRLTDYTTFEPRKFEHTYTLIDRDRWRTVHHLVQQAIHGKLCKIYPDEDPTGYWYGLVEVAKTRYTQGTGSITITAEVDPYFYDLTASDEPWLWDPFSFETGVIREYGNLTVDGTLTVTVVSSPLGGCPTFTASAAMTMIYSENAESYSLTAGANVFPEIELPHEQTAVQFEFTGTGTVSISFQGGVL
mgnify:CR=1 FL=1